MRHRTILVMREDIFVMHDQPRILAWCSLVSDASQIPKAAESALNVAWIFGSGRGTRRSVSSGAEGVGRMARGVATQDACDAVTLTCRPRSGRGNG